MIKNPELQSKGYSIVDFPLDPVVQTWVINRQWNELDQYFLSISKDEGLLKRFLLEFLDFQTLEHIISIRNAPDDEDGIWHDDGSRFCGFSLSLNFKPQEIVGGVLLFKKKIEKETQFFPPQPFGKMIIFLSGLSGFEHMVSAVKLSERIVIAGWCS